MHHRKSQPLSDRHECFTGKYTTRKIQKNYIWDPSGLFSIVYRWRNFGNFPLIFYRCYFVYIIKRTLHGGLKVKTIFYSLPALVRKILFCQSKIKFISSRHCLISSLYSLKFPNRNGAKHLIYQYYRNFRFSYVNVKYHRSQKRWKKQCPYHFLPVHIL